MNSRCSTRLAVFNGPAFNRIVQQANLARTVETLKIDVCHMSRMRIENPTFIITLGSPGINSFLSLQSSYPSWPGFKRSWSCIGSTLSVRAQRALSAWIPVQIRWTVPYLSTAVGWSVGVCSSYAFAPTDRSSHEDKYKIYWKLSQLPRSERSTDVVDIASGFNSQLGNRAEMEGHIGDRFPASANRTSN